MKESVKITVIAAGFREIAGRKSQSRPSYLPKTWRAGRDPQPISAEEPQQQPLIQHPNTVHHTNIAQHADVAQQVNVVQHNSVAPQRSAVQQPVAPQPVPPPVIQQPTIVQQVARNVSEAIHELPDDLDVPTFLRHRTQKA